MSQFLLRDRRLPHANLYTWKVGLFFELWWSRGGAAFPGRSSWSLVDAQSTSGFGRWLLKPEMLVPQRLRSMSRFNVKLSFPLTSQSSKTTPTSEFENVYKERNVTCGNRRPSRTVRSVRIFPLRIPGGHKTQLDFNRSHSVSAEALLNPRISINKYYNDRRATT